MSAAKECFFCGERKDPNDDDTVFMTVLTKAGPSGAWPCHQECVAAARHPNAGDLQPG